MTALRLVLCVLVAIAIAACANPSTLPAEPAATLPAPTAAPNAPPANTIAATAAPAQSSLVVFDRTGGFAGFRDHLTVDSDGHASVTRTSGNYEFDLSSTDLRALVGAFQSASFGELPENSMPRHLPNDAFTYVVTFQGHTVRTADTAVPESMEPVILALQRIVNSRGN